MQVPEVLDPSELDQPHSERIRQRPVDIEKKLPFVILADKDAEADDLENAQARRHYYRKATAEERGAIAIPRDDDPPAHFRRTPAYMHYSDRTLEDLMDRVEYEVDDADTTFIEKMREQYDLPAMVLDEDKFEIILDRLEKKAFQRSNKKVLERDLGTPQTNDDVPCAVCNDRDYEAKNLIVFCDGCNVAVHQDCYGVKRIPDGAWYCSKCTEEAKNVECELCPMETGAFKPTDHGTWCHLSCAIWMPGVQIDDPNKMEPICGVKSVNRDRFNLVCSVCGEKSGACIQCKHSSCVAAFHVTCAQLSGLYMNIQQGQKDVLMTAYCKKHSDLVRQRLNLHLHPQKYESDMCEKLRNGTFIAEGARLAKISQKANIKLPEAVMDEIFKYWVQKRAANSGRPLLWRLQQLAEEKLPSNLPITSSLKAHLSSNQSFMQLVALRRELERLRTICDLAKKREHLKKECLVISNRAFLIHVARLDPSLIKEQLPPLALPMSPAAHSPTKPPSTPMRNDAAADTPSEPSSEDLTQIKTVLEAAIQFAGRQSQELPKHESLMSYVTRKVYRKGLAGLRAMSKLHYVTGGNGGGSKYMLANDWTLAQLLAHIQRLINRTTSPGKRGNRRGSASADEASAKSAAEEGVEIDAPKGDDVEIDGEEEEEEGEEGEEEREVEEEDDRKRKTRGTASAASGGNSNSSPTSSSGRHRSRSPASKPGAAPPSPAKKLRQTKLVVVKKGSPKKGTVVVKAP